MSINAFNFTFLLLRTPRGNLSRAMRHINGVSTQQHNYLKRTDDPLFRGRYKAVNIGASSYLLEVSRYIQRNPAETQKPPVKGFWRMIRIYWEFIMYLVGTWPP